MHPLTHALPRLFQPKPGGRERAARAGVAVCLLLLGSGSTAADDSSRRQVYSADAPIALRAVGKLTVPGHDFIEGRTRQRDENCSATLVTRQLILTAWHCLEFYQDLSQDPIFSLPLIPGQKDVAALPAISGGSMEADWALLRLVRPIRSVTPLRIDSRSASAIKASGESITLAGYARDQHMGAGGKELTWQSSCTIKDTDEDSTQNARGGQSSTDCVTYKGASGGPVIIDNRVVGVISQGDSEQRTFFVPSERYFKAFRRLSGRPAGTP